MRPHAQQDPDSFPSLTPCSDSIYRVEGGGHRVEGEEHHVGVDNHRSPAQLPPVPWWQGISPTIAAELNLPLLSPPIEPVIDVVVIGAGIAGLSAALSASKVGAQVIVLDKGHQLGYGATGRSDGILSAGINMGI